MIVTVHVFVEGHNPIVQAGVLHKKKKKKNPPLRISLLDEGLGTIRSCFGLLGMVAPTAVSYYISTFGCLIAVKCHWDV